MPTQPPSSEPSPLLNDRHVRRGVVILLYMAVAAGAIFMVRTLQPLISLVLNVLSPFIVALIIAYIANPLVRVLQTRLRLNRLGAVLVTYLVILAVAVSAMLILVPAVYRQMSAGINGIRQGVTELPVVAERLATRYEIQISREDLQRVRDALEGRIDLQQLAGQAGPVVEGVYRQLMTWAGGIARLTVLGISVLLGFIAFITFVLMITFYFLLDYGRIGGVVRTALPLHLETRVFHLWGRVDKALSGLLRGQLIVCVLISILYTLALWMLGMRQYALLVGLMAGFGNLIPYFGPIVGGVPTAIWVLFSDNYDTAPEKLLGIIALLVLSVAIQSLDGFFFQPRIVGQSAELHPVAVILALLVGAQFGLGGMILAVPLMVVARVLIKELWWDGKVAEEAAEKAVPDESPPAAAS